MENLTNLGSEKEKLLESCNNLKSFLNPLFFSIGGSGVEVLLGNNDLKMSDIDIQIFLENDMDKKTLNNIIETFKKEGYEVEKTHNAKYVVKKNKTCYDLHILNKEGDFFVEHSNQGDFYFPIEAYKTKEGITYLAPEILLLMSKGSKIENDKNKNRIERLEKISSNDLILMLSKKFKFVKR